jgi:hypothetical protein
MGTVENWREFRPRIGPLEQLASITPSGSFKVGDGLPFKAGRPDGRPTEV